MRYQLLTPTLTQQEINTILAGLRFYQAQLTGWSDTRGDWTKAALKAHEIATEHGPALDVGEIDQLCQEINQ